MTTLRLDTPEGKNRPPAARGVTPAAGALALATPVATWWLVGDQSTVPARAGLDFAVRPWDISPGTGQAAGIAALAAAAAAALVIGRAARRHQFDGRWWSVLVPLLAAGTIAGAAWRVVTAGVIGANIGAGLAITFGGPLVVGLLAFAAARGSYLLSRAHRSRTRAASARLR